MSPIKKAFSKLQRTGKKAFVPYVMAGVDGFEKFKEQLLFLQEAGATVIEVGLPFSDPTADGPTIQRAGNKALKNGVTVAKVLNFLEEVKDKLTVPIVIMTYVNPVYQYGIENFVSQMKKSGVAGCIIPDLPLEEETMMTPFLKEANIDFIRLVTLTSNEQRLKKIIARTNGFIYAVTITGTTGTQASFSEGAAPYLQKIKALSSIPVLAGFGISTAEQVKEVCQHCDGVIVGSKLIELFEKEDYSTIQQLVNAAVQ